MKINEKNLAAFATSPNQVDREGYLMKRGDVGGSSSSGDGGSTSSKFVRRYFILKGNLLFYFDKKGDKDPLGVIILEGATVELAESESEEHFCFKVTFPSKAYILSAESQSGMEGWMKSLACASYDYVKLMADELQRQLDELCKVEGESGNPSAGAQTPTPPPRVRSTVVPAPPGGGKPQNTNIRERVRKSFALLHEEFGRKVLQDRGARFTLGAGFDVGQPYSLAAVGGTGSTTTGAAAASSTPLSLGRVPQSDLMDF